MNKIVTILRHHAKAIVAAGAPIAATALVDVLAELERAGTVGIAAAATAIAVWLVPNEE